MIRHHQHNDWLLFTQHDHALLSGRLAERIGGSVLARPSPQTVQGIALHDCGWPLHDDAPTLNPAGLPLHVFETPPPIATSVWSASARRAANKEPYSGLLVSLHVLNLSFMSLESHHDPRDVFELNKFQHAQIELQEHLRPQVGLSIHRPLTHGLAEPGASPEEDALLFDFRLLRAMDALSLALLCSENLSVSMEGLQSHSAGPEVNIRVDRPEPFSVVLSPNPFDAPSLEIPVPFRRLPAVPFRSDAEFREAYARAPVETQLVRIGAIAPAITKPPTSRLCIHRSMLENTTMVEPISDVTKNPREPAVADP